MDADLIRRIHEAPHRAIVAVTGGGSGAIAALLAVPGGSRTLLEAIVPYSSAALVEFLGGRPEQFCSAHTARQMAMAAYRRAERLRIAENLGGAPVVGLGCTASLASDRPKRGPHRIHVAAQSATATWSWSLELVKDARSRADEEAITAAVVLDLLAEACGIADRPAIALLDGETITRQRTDALPSWSDLLAGGISRTGERRGVVESRESVRAVFPGSFHPLHDGHRRMAAVAAKRLGTPIHFELSIENVEKPPLDFVEMEERASQFDAEARVWFTRAPRMKQKAALFPGATIVCGIDTLLRVADPRFAGGSEAERDRDLAEITSHGCRFLVFGRTVCGHFESLDDVSLPDALRRLCDGVPESEFRADVSSTELRRNDDL
jgi:hypothetical protein